MKLSVIAFVYIVSLFCLAVVVDVYHVGCLSCYGTVNSTCITMGYSRDQLISLRNDFRNDSNGYVSILKENGIFKFRGPRGTRAGVQKKNQFHKISTIISTNTKQNSSSQGVDFKNLTKIKTTKHVPSKCENGINLSVVNTQSLNEKTQDFMDYAIGIRSDLCVVTETFLTDLSTVTRAALQSNGYHFVDQPRLSGQARGGTGLLHRECFKVSKTSVGQKLSFEFSEWLVQWSNKRLKLCIVYHPPYSQSNPISNGTFLEEFDDYLDSIVLCDELLCISGDFNIHMNKPNDTDQIRLSSMLKSYGLINHVTVPTHKHGNTLDLIITRDNEELILSKPKAGYMISDHCFITTRLGFPCPNFTVKSISHRNIKGIDLPAFKSDLEEVSKDLLSINDIEILATQYNHRLSDCLDKHAPVVEKTITVRPKVPWYNKSLKQSKISRRKAERKWRSSKLDSDHDLFKQARNKHSNMLNNAHREYYEREILDASGNQRKLFAIIKELASVHRDNPLLQDLANRFGDFFMSKIENIRTEIDSQPCNFQCPMGTPPPAATFSTFSPLSEDNVRELIFKSKSASCDLDPIPTPLLKECIDVILPLLTKMINLSLQTGIFPMEWKLALVIPLIKKFGLELLLPNYRPVSNLPFVSKLVEKAAISQENPHIQSNCPLPDMVSAYREGHSTESALLKVQADILHNMEQQKVTILVLIDLSAAFDTIDHNILFSRLESKFGITGTALTWHKSYLEARKQCVLLGDNVRSTESVLRYGVPQGSCLGPILFAEYASTLFDVIYRHIDGAHGYADDHQLYLAFSPNSVSQQNDAVRCMETCLSDVKDWMLANKLKMNDSKTEFIIIGSRQQLDKIQFDSIKVGNSVVKAVESVRDLGAFFDSTMSMECHIDSKCSAAFRQLYSIRRIRKFLTREATETLVHAFIFSHLDYCNGLLCDLPQYQIAKLQRIQNMAARLVFKLPKFTHVTPLMVELHWLPVSYRIKFKLLLYVFKGIHGSAPKYICHMFNFHASQYSFRRNSVIEDIQFHNGNIIEPIQQNSVFYLIVPKTNRVTFEQRSLAVAGPKLWNSLPIHLRCINAIDDFKKQLKTYYFKLAYKV